jgi:chromosome segregation ATPase
MQRLKLWAGLFGGLLVLALAVASMASAHGGDTTKIHSCVNNNSGTIKIVSPSTSCGNGETALDWSQGVTPADLAPLQAQIAAAQAQINQVQAQLSAQIAAGDGQLQGQISNLQQTVQSQQASIQSLQGQVNSQGAQITQVQGQLTAQINQVQTQLAAQIAAGDSQLQAQISTQGLTIGQLQAYDAALKNMLQQWHGAIINSIGNVLSPVP